MVNITTGPHLSIADTFVSVSFLDHDETCVHMNVSTGYTHILSSIGLANANCAFMADTLGPETVDDELSVTIVRHRMKSIPRADRNSPSFTTIMTQQQPISEQTLSQDIMNCPRNRFSINANALAKR
jgi:hypothetical protein